MNLFPLAKDLVFKSSDFLLIYLFANLESCDEFVCVVSPIKILSAPQVSTMITAGLLKTIELIADFNYTLG